MKKMMLQEVNTTYEPFSLEPEYLEENRAFLGRADFNGIHRALDIACGNGVSAEMLLRAQPTLHLNGVDFDQVQIDLIQERFAQLGYTVKQGFELTDQIVENKPVLVFGKSHGDDLPFRDGAFDCVTIANAIHMLPDKELFVTEASRVLRAGGLFGFNSSFYAGTFPDGTEGFYTNWLKLAVQSITRRNQELIDAGKEPIRRVRKTGHQAFQNRWLSKHEWTELMAKNDIEVVDLRERVVMLNERCFIAISAYVGMVEVLLSGYPVEEASWALQSTVAPALEAFGANEVPRNWLEVWAKKAS
jgi:ubiquinone/menaquinone biosynthesis C-methylase UbiE